MPFDPKEIVLHLPVLLFSLSVHECAHAWVARKGGDDTSYLQGRITLNPISHIDPIGTIVLPLAAMISGAPMLGWAKPVPVNPARPKRSVWMVWIALAGPASNILIALATLLALKVALLCGVPLGRGDENGPAAHSALFDFGFTMLQLNIILAVFNMLPIPPLDGSRLLAHFIRYKGPFWGMFEFLERFGFLILFLAIQAPPIRFALSLLYQIPLYAAVAFLAL